MMVVRIEKGRWISDLFKGLLVELGMGGGEIRKRS